MSLIDLPNFTHRQAILEVYRHTPQIRDYDRFMHCGARWLPYTMYFHEKNFVSDAINTDTLGFRYAHFRGRRYSVAELPKDEPISLLVGGSTALGVGACSDNASLASRLASDTGEIWLNFSGRGFNATQELVMFLMHQDKFLHINRVVFLSGINTLALEGIPEEFSSDHGRYYYSFEFQHYMNQFNEDMKRKKNGFDVMGRSALSSLRRLKFWRGPEENPADRTIDDSTVTLDERLDRAAAQIAKALHQWTLLLVDFNVRPVFFLQPLSYWCEKSMTREERLVFHAIDSCPNNFYRLFGNVLGKEVHEPFFEAIRRKSRDVLCYDMNRLLRSSPSFRETLFVDRVHFNDVGNAELSRLMAPLV